MIPANSALSATAYVIDLDVPAPETDTVPLVSVARTFFTWKRGAFSPAGASTSIAGAWWASDMVVEVELFPQIPPP